MQRPDISPQARNDWGIVRDLVVGIGVGVAIHKNLSVGQLLSRFSVTISPHQAAELIPHFLAVAKPLWPQSGLWLFVGSPAVYSPLPLSL